MENWKDIEGYEGMYQVSDLGRIRSLDRYVRNSKTMSIKKGRVLKLHNHVNGYLRVSLCRDGSERYTMVHRIVANAFIGGQPGESFVVMHLNDCKKDNRAENLKWGTNQENSMDAYLKGLTKNPMAGKFNEENHFSKPVNQCQITGEFIRRFPNSYEVKRTLGINQGNIIQVCKGGRNHAGGFKWAYAEV
jgi:hypothetical protein